jgi:hypothetical protein
MPALRRTYSFEASPDLAARVARASRALAALPSDSPDLEAWLARELEMGCAVLRRAAPDLAGDSAVFMRAAVELVVGATEKVAVGLGIEDELRAWDREDTEGDAFRRGALKASTQVWRDG